MLLCSPASRSKATPWAGQSAPVTLRVYSDLECFTARGWVVELLPAIIKRYVRSGEMRIEFRSFKTDTRNPTTFLNQQTAAIASGAQGKLWNFVETFYYEQGEEYTPYVTERYARAGGSPNRW